jgi:hypothetical protein
MKQKRGYYAALKIKTPLLYSEVPRWMLDLPHRFLCLP